MNLLRSSLIVTGTALAIGLFACNGGLKSKACVTYFEKNEACAAKTTNKVKADAMRQTAAVSKANFEKNSNAMAVSKSCEMMLQQLESDPDCK
jgi:hypothetical protein